MRDFKGKTAFVTGGASGIGLALGRAFAEVGMKVMLADVEDAALDKAVRQLGEAGASVQGVVCDVSDRAAVERAARHAFATFGKVHVVCNNAGVAAGGAMEQIPQADWDWVIGVNLMGVISGISIFLPHIKAHGEGGHIVNTASMAGMLSPPQMGPYNVTKHAVVALSETLANELAGSAIGVSVLCPGWVNTRINESGRNRPARFGTVRDVPLAAPERSAEVAQLLRNGMSPEAVAVRVLAAIRDNDLYIYTHPEMRPALEDRFQRILAAYGRWSAFQDRSQG
jgi:NAD(P)-dependent dehydrogenase (short-subunit alcohol dehydrogenase family)